MIKHCLGCDVEFEGSVQAKYHDEACSDRARKRRIRDTVSPALPVSQGDEFRQEEPRYEEEGKEPGVVLEASLKASGLDPKLRNTIHDPNPEWAPDKIITEGNRKMTCLTCGKLSLTHKRKEDGGLGPCFPTGIGGFSYSG